MSSTPRVARAAWIAALLLATAPLSACAAIWGFQDSLDGSVDAGRQDAVTDATQPDRGETVVPPKDVHVTDAPVSDPCTTTVAESYAYYVSETGGSDTTTCGPVTQPCRSISQALLRAQTNSVPIVNVAEGSYEEALTMMAAGVTVVGGWTRNFVKDSSPSAPAQLVVAPKTEAMTVSASYSGTATICAMTLQSKAAADHGETLYGVFASGASTKLELRDVVIAVNPGGDGSAGAMGAVGIAGKGACASGAGTMGNPDGVPGMPGVAGVFDTTGYVPGNGAPGGVGSAGSAGIPAVMAPCITCVGGCIAVGCGPTKESLSCGHAGSSGCPGQGGDPGKGGEGGGASIGIFASSGAIVTLGGVKVVVRDGGSGGRGGPGGNGGPGSSGVEGAKGSSCDTACNSGLGCKPVTPERPDGGAPGGTGGTGSSGGPGGGGSGGFSCAIVSGADASVAAGDASITHGAGGAGAGGAPPGGNGADAGICSF